MIQAKVKVKNHAKKRALNALAIAEQQSPGNAKVRRHRVGELDQSDYKRKRDISQEEAEDETAGQAHTKRLRSEHRDKFGGEIEAGSDSEGNEWMLGYVDSDNDSDLDSHEALGESDEERFEGFTFRGSSTTKTKDKSQAIPRDRTVKHKDPQEIDIIEQREGDASLHEESDDFREDAVDLATMLDDSDTEEPTGSGDESKLSFCSDDEISTAGSEDSLDQPDSDLAVSDAEDDANNVTKLAALQTLVSSLENSEKSLKKGRYPLNDAQETSNPSEFGINPRQKLTLEDLQSTVTDPQFKRSLRLMADDYGKSNKHRNGIPKKLEVPLAKRQQDRLDRSAAYERSKETLNRWIDTVKHNRRAEHLSFPLAGHDAAADQGSKKLLPIGYSHSLTGLESTIQDILVGSGLATTNEKSQEEKLQEFEELQTNKLPIEEVQARRAELRKARELLFREEIRAKRIKKIKSKSYRRVHRKERERDAQREKEALAASGVDPSDGEQGLNDRRRAEERMGTRHRESKWARGIKGSGRAAWDEDARNGVIEMAKREEELRKRIEGKDINAEDDNSLGSLTETSDEDGDSDTANGERHRQRLREELQNLKGEEKPDITSAGRQPTLSSMKFMQNAERSQRERNDADAEITRRVLAGEDVSDEGQAEEVPGRRKYGVKEDQTHATRRPIIRRNEFEERSTPEPDEAANLGPTANDIEIIVDKNKDYGKTKPSYQPSQQLRDNTSTNFKEPKSLLENPWLSIKSSSIKHGKAQAQDKTVLISNTPLKPISEPLSITASETVSSQPPASPTFSGFSDDNETENIQPTLSSNHDLIRQAFAGDEVAANFEAEKAATMLVEEEKVIDTSLPGWGSWTGIGISKRELKRNQKYSKAREVVRIEGIKKEKRVDWGLEKVIINEKRVKKVCCPASRPHCPSSTIFKLILSFLYSELQISRTHPSTPVRNTSAIRTLLTSACRPGMDHQGDVPGGDPATSVDEARRHFTDGKTVGIAYGFSIKEEKKVTRDRASATKIRLRALLTVFEQGIWA